MSIIMSVLSVVCLISAGILTRNINKKAFRGVTRLAFVPFPILSIVIAIDATLFVVMLQEVKYGAFVGNIKLFNLSEHILLAAIALMVVFVVISAIISGSKGFLCALVCMVVFLVATLCTTYVLAIILKALLRIAGLVILILMFSFAGIFMNASSLAMNTVLWSLEKTKE